MGAGQYGGQERCLAPGQAAGGNMEICFCGRTNASDPFAPINGVEIHFQNSLLGEKELKQYRIICLKPFPDPGPGRPEKYGPGHLHGDGAGATVPFSRGHILECFVKLDKIKTPMDQKTLILSRKDRFF